MTQGLTDFSPVSAVSKTRQFTEHVRELVVSGRLPAGTKLPSTQALAAEWGTTVATVHSALTPLVKAGLLDRRPRVGTHVRSRETRLRRIGIYRAQGVSSAAHGAFQRTVTEALCERIGASNREWSLWTDPRPEAEHDDPWAGLERAAGRRRIEALIVPCTDDRHLAWQLRLPIPAAFLSSARIPNRVDLDGWQFGRDAVYHLAARGCRSVGLICVSGADLRYADGTPHEMGRIARGFIATAADLGLELRDEWLGTPRTGGVREQDAERFGYDAIHALWRQPARPEGLVVNTDVAARGVILGLLELGVKVPEGLRLVLHRNRQVGLLCPFPAAFLDVDVYRVADELIGLIERQYAGESVKEVVLCHTLETTKEQ